MRGRADSPRINATRFTGPDHPARDRPLVNLQEWIDIFNESDLPILSGDGQKKERIGNFTNPGAVRRRQPGEVNVSDFRTDAACRATPYGISDLGAGRGPIGAGTSSDTSAFAVEAIGTWWSRSGCQRYWGADEWLSLADGGGSDGHRPRLRKTSLQERIADRDGWHVTVCHDPPGASKGNPVEHRLFGPVSINWAGQPLRSLEIQLGWVRGTAVGGVGVTASLDRATDPTMVKVSEAEMERLDLERHEVGPAWNYTISPRHRELLN